MATAFAIAACDEKREDGKRVEVAPLEKPEPIKPANPPVEKKVLVVPREDAGCVWTARPTLADLMKFYPKDALTVGLQGRALLACDVASDTTLSCTVRSEEPAGHGFGEAAVRASKIFRASCPESAGRDLLMPIMFVPPN